jgi:hypothetical protein
LTEHIDIPIAVVDELIMNVAAGKNSEVLGALTSIRDALRNPDVRSIFEINALTLIHHQTNRIAELEETTEGFLTAIVEANDGHQYDNSFTTDNFREWLTTSKAAFEERIKGLVKR